jgi:pyrimidine-nucleoside phosphorylase
LGFALPGGYRQPEPVNFLTVIEGKRDGQRLGPDQIQEMVGAYTAGQIPDYQMAAFLMAVYFRGLDKAETTALTLAMRDSGDVLKFPKDPRPLVDKHSTGGVGDKVSLPLAPLLACLGFRVPMISGRGLGITGGTLDKLDSIPGFKTSLSADRIIQIVQRVGCVICGQTERMVPADKGLYALRDVTATVPSIPLIVASILSKKLAEGLDALVLDVKFGAAAFMPTLRKARELGRAMVALGNKCGVATRALITNMDAPVGRAAGNWLEVREAVDCLEGKGPADLVELLLASAAQLIVQTRRATSLHAAHKLASDALASGQPRRKWDEMLVAQGADIPAFRQKMGNGKNSKVIAYLLARSPGFVSSAHARIIGEVIRDMGGGRVAKDSKINHDVGLDRMAKPGDPVKNGSLLARIHAPDERTARAAKKRLENAFVLSKRKGRGKKLIAATL